MWDDIKSQGKNQLSLYGLILFLSTITCANGYITFQSLPDFFYKQENIKSISNSCTFTWLKENYSRNTIIATNKPYHLSFFKGYSTVLLPNKKWFPNASIPDNMELILSDHMSTVGGKLLVLYEEAQEEHYGSFISGLFYENKNSDKFILLHKCSDGVIYSLRE